MGASPGGIVFDPKGEPVIGLVEVKCLNVASYVDCPYIVNSEGTHKLRKTQGQMFCIQILTEPHDVMIRLTGRMSRSCDATLGKQNRDVCILDIPILKLFNFIKL